MEINLLGAVAALTVFLSIWIGHVSVRKIEAASASLRAPMLAAILLGLAFVLAALLTTARPVSVVCGIVGVTLLWDAFELKRQEKRIRKGHAPANPANPRHARMLAEPEAHATTLDILKRDPVGRPVSPEEAVRLAGKH